MILIHVAAEPRFGGLFQDCSRCGHVFQDLTGSQPMVLEEDAGCGIPYWTPGQRVAVNGGASWVLGDDVPLDPGETECKATS